MSMISIEPGVIHIKITLLRTYSAGMKMITIIMLYIVYQLHVTYSFILLHRINLNQFNQKEYMGSSLMEGQPMYI